MPEEPSEETFLHHQPLDSRPMVVRRRLSRGWAYDFYPDRIARKSEPATVVLCGGSRDLMHKLSSGGHFAELRGGQLAGHALKNPAH